MELPETDSDQYRQFSQSSFQRTDTVGGKRPRALFAANRGGDSFSGPGGGFPANPCFPVQAPHGPVVLQISRSLKGRLAVGARRSQLPEFPVQRREATCGPVVSRPGTERKLLSNTGESTTVMQRAVNIPRPVALMLTAASTSLSIELMLMSRSKPRRSFSFPTMWHRGILQRISASSPLSLYLKWVEEQQSPGNSEGRGAATAATSHRTELINGRSVTEAGAKSPGRLPEPGVLL